MFSTVLSPKYPVNALAFPELTSIALIEGFIEDFKLFLQLMTGALAVKDLVKIPPIELFLSSSISKRSSLF